VAFRLSRLTQGGHRPPVSLEDIVIYPPGLDEAANQTGSPFSRCKQYVGDFKVAGAMYNVSAFFLAAFALQESGCQPDAVADAGTYGLMQLSRVGRAMTKAKSLLIGLLFD
jgi:soluble lytic murein transglycosylase-like protein